MTQHRLVWQARETVAFEVIGEWPEPVKVTARPIITSHYFGTTVGMYYRDANSFGYWCSSDTCSLLTAWRVAQILPRVQHMRNNSHGYDSTLCGLVIAMGRGDRHEDRMRERAKDLDMTVEELDAELIRIGDLWPTAVELRFMWVRLPEREQNELARTVRGALDNGNIDHDDQLVALVEKAELCNRDAAEQRRHEEDLIAKGLDDKPWDSLKLLMRDLGVSNLAYTRGCGDFGEPSHFKMADLDREIMRELIGEWGGGHVELYTTAKDPDDPSAHWSEGGSSFTVYGSDFGEATPPKAMFGDIVIVLAYVRYDRVTERFQLALRPAGSKDGDNDVFMTISDLRAEIGKTYGVGKPLEPGHIAPWAAHEVRAAVYTDDAVQTDENPDRPVGWWARLRVRLGLG